MFKHIKDYFASINLLYQVGYIRDNNGAEIDVAVQYAGQPIQYVEAKMRNNSTVKDDNGIIVYGLKNTPGYVISKTATDYGLTQRNETQLYRVPAVPQGRLYQLPERQRRGARVFEKRMEDGADRA